MIPNKEDDRKDKGMWSRLQTLLAAEGYDLRNWVLAPTTAAVCASADAHIATSGCAPEVCVGWDDGTNAVFLFDVLGESPQVWQEAGEGLPHGCDGQIVTLSYPACAIAQGVTPDDLDFGLAVFFH